MQDDDVRHQRLPPGITVTCCSHPLKTRIERHAVGTYRYTVVYLDASMHGELPLDAQVRLRVEANISGVPVKGAWQPACGLWYLMLPEAPLTSAGVTIGSAAEAAFASCRSMMSRFPTSRMRCSRRRDACARHGRP